MKVIESTPAAQSIEEGEPLTLNAILTPSSQTNDAFTGTENGVAMAITEIKREEGMFFGILEDSDGNAH